MPDKRLPEYPDLIHYSRAKSTSESVLTRRSLRAFLPHEVPGDVVRELLQSSARAPSGTNTQPWNVIVLTGATRQRLCDAVCAAFDDESQQHSGEQKYYPDKWSEPYLSRRRKVGWALYGLLGITKGDFEKTHHQHRRNFQFFDAPVGLIFTIPRDLAVGSWLDYGMFLQNIMLLAREAGLHSCPQAAWASYHKVIRSVLPIGDDETVVCGMALGYADEKAIENTLVTERAQLDDFVQFLS